MNRSRDFSDRTVDGCLYAPRNLDGVLAEAEAVSKRLPFQSDPAMRKSINSGDTEYVDTHLSHSAQQAWFGFYGNLDVAVVEVAAILPNGRTLVPGSSVGNSKTWLDLADKVILEVNYWHPRGYEGFHDVYYGTRRPPERLPIQLLEPMQRIGDPVPACRSVKGSRRRRDECARQESAVQTRRRGFEGDRLPSCGLPPP